MGKTAEEQWIEFLEEKKEKQIFFNMGVVLGANIVYDDLLDFMRKRVKENQNERQERNQKNRSNNRSV